MALSLKRPIGAFNSTPAMRSRPQPVPDRMSPSTRTYEAERAINAYFSETDPRRRESHARRTQQLLSSYNAETVDTPTDIQESPDPEHDSFEEQASYEDFYAFDMEDLGSVKGECRIST